MVDKVKHADRIVTAVVGVIGLMKPRTHEEMGSAIRLASLLTETALEEFQEELASEAAASGEALASALNAKG